MKTIKQLLTLAAMLPVLASAQNPIISTVFTPDPAPFVYGDKVYLFTDHDEDGRNRDFNMKDWMLFSTEDMVNWTYLGTQVSTSTFKWARQGQRAWACQGVERNGKWYWYVCCNKATGGDALAVAVADDPQEYLDELAFLAETAGAMPVKRFVQRLDTPNNATYVGPGKLQEIKALKINGLREDVYTTFASIYANCGKVDSAMWFLQLPPQSNDSSYLNSNNYLEAMSQIYKARGDSINYLKTSYQCDRNSFKLLRDPYIVKIMTTELQFDEHYKNEQEQKRRTRNYFLWAIASAIILSLLLLALLLYLRNHRYDKLVLELKDQSQSQMQDLTDMQQSINELQINDERLKGFISSHVGMMREIIEACYHEPNNRIAENMKRIVKFQDSNKDNWVRLFDYIDLEHNNIMTRTRENYPDLNDRELLLLALTCMGFTYIQIAIIMGYSNATSVSVIKQRLVKKMGLDCSLNEYIQNNDKMKK